MGPLYRAPLYRKESLYWAILVWSPLYRGVRVWNAPRYILCEQNDKQIRNIKLRKLSNYM